MPTVNEKIGQYGKELIDYEAIVKNYPWIIQEKMNCILSPDSDGLLCGLLMGHVFDWSVKGFYDGNILVVEKGVDIQRCVFLDMEILRQGICSVGHHMLLYNKRNVPAQLDAPENCISINTIRKYDAQHDFAQVPICNGSSVIGHSRQHAHCTISPKCAYGVVVYRWNLDESGKIYRELVGLDSLSASGRTLKSTPLNIHE